MVWENNITSVPQMKTLLEVFMKEALFSGHHIRAITNKQEKSSSSYPDNVSILNYDRRSHHPATRIMFLYCHMYPGSWMMTSPVI
jgi:hypothetical protein